MAEGRLNANCAFEGCWHEARDLSVAGDHITLCEYHWMWLRAEIVPVSPD